jgi:hypothetical protein
VSSRRARSAQPVPSAVIDTTPPSARVAWSYVAILAAAIVTGLLVVISNAVVAPAACRAATGSDFADCKFGWLVWVTIVAFVLCLLPAALALKLGGWMWAAAVSAFGLLLTTGAYDQAWWWVTVALVPAAAALLSTNWERGSGLRWAQRAVIVALAIAAVVTMAWWLANS